MLHKEFLLLSEDEQYTIAAEKGVQVAERQDNSYRYILYQIDSFYLEGKLELERDDIQSITSFSSTELLMPYLDQISLPVFK